jgi:hypothetical protein
MLVVCCLTHFFFFFIRRDRATICLAALRGAWRHAVVGGDPSSSTRAEGWAGAAGDEDMAAEEELWLRRRLGVVSVCYAALKALFFVESTIATVLWHVQASALAVMGVTQLMNFGHGNGNHAVPWRVDMLLWSLAAVALLPWLVFVAMGQWQFGIAEFLLHFGMLVMSMAISATTQRTKRTLWAGQQRHKRELEGDIYNVCVCVCVLYRYSDI